MAVGFTGTDFQPEPSILDPFRTIFDVLGPTWKSGLGQKPAWRTKTWPGPPNQARRFRNFFLGPRKKFRNRQAWLRASWLSYNLHSRPLTKYFPPLEAATAADWAQAFEPVLRRTAADLKGGLGGSQENV